MWMLVRVCVCGNFCNDECLFRLFTGWLVALCFRQTAKLCGKSSDSLAGSQSIRDSRQATGASRIALAQKDSRLKPSSDGPVPASRLLRRSPSVAKYVNKLGLSAEDSGSSVTPLTAGNQRAARQPQATYSGSTAAQDNQASSHSIKQPPMHKEVSSVSSRADRNGLVGGTSADNGGMSRIATAPVKPSGGHKRPRKPEGATPAAEEPPKKMKKEAEKSDLYAWKS